MMGVRERLLVMGLMALLIAGCGGGLVRLSVEVVEPPRLPIRTHPNIIVVAEGRTSVVVANRLADHLSTTGASRIFRMSPEEEAALRALGRVPPASVVVHVDGVVGDGTPPLRLNSDQELVRSRPSLEARLRLITRDATSGYELDRVDLPPRRARSLEPAILRLELIEEMVTSAIAAVDERRDRIALHLYGSEDPEAARAIEELRFGFWRRGRLRLERVVRTEEFREWPREAQARLLHDLGQARRFDAVDPPDVRFAGARRAIRAAHRMLEEPSLHNELVALERQRRARLELEERERQAAYNFARADGLMLPDPPPGYGR